MRDRSTSCGTGTLSPAIRSGIDAEDELESTDENLDDIQTEVVVNTLFIVCFYHTPCVSVKHRLKLRRYPSFDFLVGSFIGRPILHP